MIKYHEQQFLQHLLSIINSYYLMLIMYFYMHKWTSTYINKNCKSLCAWKTTEDSIAPKANIIISLTKPELPQILIIHDVIKGTAPKEALMKKSNVLVFTRMALTLVDRNISSLWRSREQRSESNGQLLHTQWNYNI